jgi:hypothetical protein
MSWRQKLYLSGPGRGAAAIVLILLNADHNWWPVFEGEKSPAIERPLSKSSNLFLRVENVKTEKHGNNCF